MSVCLILSKHITLSSFYSSLATTLTICIAGRSMSWKSRAPAFATRENSSLIRPSTYSLASLSSPIDSNTSFCVANEPTILQYQNSRAVQVLAHVDVAELV